MTVTDPNGKPVTFDAVVRGAGARDLLPQGPLRVLPHARLQPRSRRLHERVRREQGHGQLGHARPPDRRRPPARLGHVEAVPADESGREDPLGAVRAAGRGVSATADRAMLSRMRPARRFVGGLRHLLPVALCALGGHLALYRTLLPSTGDHAYLAWYEPLVAGLTIAGLAAFGAAAARGRARPRVAAPRRRARAAAGDRAAAARDRPRVRLALASVAFLVVQETIERTLAEGRARPAAFGPSQLLLVLAVVAALAALVALVERSCSQLIALVARSRTRVALRVRRAVLPGRAAAPRPAAAIRSPSSAGSARRPSPSDPSRPPGRVVIRRMEEACSSHVQDDLLACSYRPFSRHSWRRASPRHTTPPCRSSRSTTRTGSCPAPPGRTACTRRSRTPGGSCG